MVVFPGTAQKTVTADQYTIYLRYLLGWCRTAGWMRNTKAIQQGVNCIHNLILHQQTILYQRSAETGP